MFPEDYKGKDAPLPLLFYVLLEILATAAGKRKKENERDRQGRRERGKKRQREDTQIRKHLNGFFSNYIIW